MAFELKELRTNVVDLQIDVFVCRPDRPREDAPSRGRTSSSTVAKASICLRHLCLAIKDMLAGMGRDLGPGFYLGRPEPASNFIARVTAAEPNP